MKELEKFKDLREVALKRYAVIAPLLEDGLEPAEARKRRADILAKETMVSERTLRRYLVAYREKGFDGLCTRQRADAGRPRVVSPELLAEAVSLKRELPQRSVRAVIEILEGEGRVKKSSLRPSTLARHFAKLGLMEIPKHPREAFGVSRKIIVIAFGKLTSSMARI
jgi:putative transposase